MLKRILAVIVLACIVLSVVGCGAAKQTDEHHEMIENAVDAMLNAWRDEYAQESYEGTDGTLQIKNTRLLILKENTNPYYQDIAYIVDFVVFSDMFGTAPYYMDAGYLNNVVVYKNGTMEVTSNYVRQVASRTYNYDLSDILEDVKDYTDAYNMDKKLK